MPNTASSWKNMMQIQRARAVEKKNNARVADINAALAANAAKVATAAVVGVAPLVVPALAPGPGINLSNLTPAQHTHLAAVVASMRPRKTELELSYEALKKAETGKKRSRRTRRVKRT